MTVGLEYTFASSLGTAGLESTFVGGLGTPRLECIFASGLATARARLAKSEENYLSAYSRVAWAQHVQD